MKAPISVDRVGHTVQSERLHLYGSYAKELLASDHAYYCFCSREQLEVAVVRRSRPDARRAIRGPAAVCRPTKSPGASPSGERPAIRFRVPENREVVFADAVRGEVRFHTDVIGDPVIVRAEGIPAYNFAVVVDDALMAITHVIRGEDHISNTPRQILLYEALGFAPPAFAHLSLVMGPDHAPLSKRHGATSVDEFRSKGYLPEARRQLPGADWVVARGRRRAAARAGACQTFFDRSRRD